MFCFFTKLWGAWWLQIPPWCLSRDMIKSGIRQKLALYLQTCSTEGAGHHSWEHLVHWQSFGWGWAVCFTTKVPFLMHFLGQSVSKGRPILTGLDPGLHFISDSCHMVNWEVNSLTRSPIKSSSAPHYGFPLSPGHNHVTVLEILKPWENVAFPVSLLPHPSKKRKMEIV